MKSFASLLMVSALTIGGLAVVTPSTQMSIDVKLIMMSVALASGAFVLNLLSRFKT